MPLRWPAKLKALLLAAVLLSGGSGLPLLDLVLFHGFVANRLSSSHYEPSGEHHGHSDLCRLGLTAPASPQADRADVTLPQSRIAFQAPPQPSDLTPPSSDAGLLPRPRAPPSLTA